MPESASGRITHARLLAAACDAEVPVNVIAASAATAITATFAVFFIRELPFERSHSRGQGRWPRYANENDRIVIARAANIQTVQDDLTPDSITIW